MRPDPMAEYRRAVQAYVQWFRLWMQSRDLAHRKLAYASLDIAREKQIAVQLQLTTTEGGARRQRRGRQYV